MKKDDLKQTRHHILPRSKGGTNDPSNIAMVKQGLHRKYHDLFNNKTPEEILEFLENYFWNGDEDFITRYYWDKETEKAKGNLRKTFTRKGDAN